MAFLWPPQLPMERPRTLEDPGSQRLHGGFRDPGAVGTSWTVEGMAAETGGWGLGDVGVSEFMAISWLFFEEDNGLWLTNYN